MFGRRGWFRGTLSQREPVAKLRLSFTATRWGYFEIGKLFPLAFGNRWREEQWLISVPRIAFSPGFKRATYGACSNLLLPSGWISISSWWSVFLKRLLRNSSQREEKFRKYFPIFLINPPIKGEDSKICKSQFPKVTKKLWESRFLVDFRGFLFYIRPRSSPVSIALPTYAVSNVHRGRS